LGTYKRNLPGPHTSSDFTVAAIVVDFYSQGMVVHGNWQDMRQYFGTNDVSFYFLKVADGISPGQGNDVLGPTAIIKSVDTINQEASTVGVLHNTKITPYLLEGNQGISNFIAMLRTHDQMGGAQIQFNCVDRKTLIAAQETPSEYRSLMVRVAGYSAFFVELCEEIQDEIISRTPQRSLTRY